MFTFFDSNAAPVSSNIQHYLANARLPLLRLGRGPPPMPNEKHKSHRNHLVIRTDLRREFHRTYRIKSSYVDTLTMEFIRKHIPSDPVPIDDVDPDTDERPCIPCEGFKVEVYTPLPLRHIEELGLSWLENVVLRSIQRILQMIPEYQLTNDYCFSHSDGYQDIDHKIFRYFLWEKTPDDSSRDRDVKLILAYQPPWILSPRDMMQFTTTRSVPSFDELRRGARYNSSQKVWAKLWDVCRANGCHSFILTNYRQWVFGGFSSRRDYGFNTSIKYAYSCEPKGSQAKKAKQPISRTPTLLEYITFWIVSSMGMSDKFVLPSMLEMITLAMAIDDEPEVISEKATNDVTAPREVEPSESEWSDVSDIPSSAGVRLDNRSDSGRTPPPFLNENWQVSAVPSQVIANNKEQIKTWIHTSQKRDFVRSGPPSIARAPSPVQSEWSEASITAAKKRSRQGYFNMETTLKEVYEFDFT